MPPAAAAAALVLVVAPPPAPPDSDCAGRPWCYAQKQTNFRDGHTKRRRLREGQSCAPGLHACDNRLACTRAGDPASLNPHWHANCTRTHPRRGRFRFGNTRSARSLTSSPLRQPRIEHRSPFYKQQRACGRVRRLNWVSHDAKIVRWDAVCGQLCVCSLASYPAPS